MYDCTNIGFLVVALIFPGGAGGIAYALRVEHPYPQYFQLRIRIRDLLACIMAVGGV
jgi:hypothetical protein